MCATKTWVYNKKQEIFVRNCGKPIFWCAFCFVCDLFPGIFFSAWPCPLTLNSEIWGCARLLWEPLGFRVKKWYFLKRSGRGSNPRPRASEEDALSTPLRPTWPLPWKINLCFVATWKHLYQFTGTVLQFFFVPKLLHSAVQHFKSLKVEAP